MASLFGHGLLGYTLSKIVKYRSTKLLLLLAVISAILPDIDVLAFNFGIAYEHPLGHRGFTHSIMFALVWAFIVAIFFKVDKLKVYCIIFLSTISHGVLDALTTGGKGVGFFIPLDNSRYFLPCKIIKVSPLGVGNFFSEWGLRVIYSELKYIAIPCIVVLVLLFFYKKKNSSKEIN